MHFNIYKQAYSDCIHTVSLRRLAGNRPFNLQHTCFTLKLLYQKVSNQGAPTPQEFKTSGAQARSRSSSLTLSAEAANRADSFGRRILECDL